MWSGLARRYRKLRNGPFRLRVALPVIAVAGLAVYLLLYASPQTIYLHDVALEVGGDLVGAIIIVAILTPLIARARDGRIRERGRLDYEVFTDHVAAATSSVKVLDTHSALFDRPDTGRVLEAFRKALQRNTRIQILLLHPNSTGVAVRSEERHRDTIRAEIRGNIRILGEFASTLPEAVARRFEVRLYATAASTTLYRWDDRALVSFLSFGRHNPGGHLEIDLGTSLGHFVEEHFSELWHEAMPLERYLKLHVILINSNDGTAQDFPLPYVQVDGVHYLADPQLLAHLVQVHASGGTVTARLANRPGEELQIRVVDNHNDALRQELSTHFMEKYGWPGQAFLYLDDTGATDPEGRWLRFGRREPAPDQRKPRRQPPA